MRRRDAALVDRMTAALDTFERDQGPLPGVQDPVAREVLLRQLVESVHRIQYVSVIRDRHIADVRADPNNPLFDPLKAAILASRAGNIDEAFWLIFLFVHFGKHRRAGWRYVREIYGRLGDGARWDWAATSTDPAAFRAWLNEHKATLMRVGVPRGFGNHRKYESLDAYSDRGTGTVIQSYIEWVNPPRTHSDLVAEAIAAADGDSRVAFRALYESMSSVVGFGRTARFDYLAMTGKVGLAAIEPDSTYLKGATGPAAGARLLFEAGNRLAVHELEERAHALESNLHVGMQALEDALCNWQKSPTVFKPFRG
jgi:hypothetical protein